MCLGESAAIRASALVVLGAVEPLVSQERVETAAALMDNEPSCPWKLQHALADVGERMV